MKGNFGCALCLVTGLNLIEESKHKVIKNEEKKKYETAKHAIEIIVITYVDSV